MWQTIEEERHTLIKIIHSLLIARYGSVDCVPISESMCAGAILVLVQGLRLVLYQCAIVGKSAGRRRRGRR